MNSPLLMHINETIEAIEESSDITKLKNSMSGVSSLFGNNDDKFKHGHVGDVVYTSKMLGKISVFDIYTSGIIFKDYSYLYTSNYKIPSIKKSNLIYIGNENTGAPDWNMIERNVKFIHGVIPKAIKSAKPLLDRNFSSPSIKINAVDAAVFEHGVLLNIQLVSDIIVRVGITSTGGYDVLDIMSFTANS